MNKMDKTTRVKDTIHERRKVRKKPALKPWLIATSTKDTKTVVTMAMMMLKSRLGFIAADYNTKTR